MRHSVTRVLPYTPRQLFDLVGDVERYPLFVPWVLRLRTWNPRTEAEEVSIIDAEAEVGFSIVHERFATTVRRDAAALAIDVDLISGPFRKLENRWRFKEHPRGAELTFTIDFEFKSRLLTTLLAANFHRACNRLIACFEERARALFARDA